ncbi:MAG TPA: DUF6077 domain-containing protein [Rhodanobacteraceae bacterium]|nr:DUF6077 domain-containing protein [Rhodanobacteraceae bacterium]
MTIARRQSRSSSKQISIVQGAGDRRLAVNHALDRLVPLFVLPYAVWTMYVHLITATHSSFDTLLHWLPMVMLVAAAAPVAWFRLPQPAKQPDAVAIGREAVPGPLAALVARAIGDRTAPFAVLALAVLWVGLLSAGMPYPLFWWVALLAAGAAWMLNLRGKSCATADGDAGRHAIWIALLVAAAAVCVTLVASRPDADDAFYRSISATLLRFPQQPVLVHDTLYRLPDVPILLQFYRLSNYDVLVATLARIAGIDHLVVAYLVLPAVLAALCVVAWVYLLQRIVPARWPWLLLFLFLCVLALGETHRAYGNFAFVRLFQGKAILATGMVPIIAGSALVFARHGGTRRWILLFAAEIAALGASASALFVAPAAAALGLAGGWSANAAGSRRFAVGMLASAYVFGAGWAMASVTHGGQALVSSSPMPDVLQILDETWGWWSTRLLLVALLAGWAFVVNPVRARYLSAGAFFFLLAALDPYTVRFVADRFVGVYTYWRLTWALPLPFFLAVLLEGVIKRVSAVRSKVLAACACAALAALAIAFGWRFGTLRSANSVTLGLPGLKVSPVEYGVAANVAEDIPEKGVVLAPQAVSIWLPSFVVHPELLGVRGLYLTRAFSLHDAARRSLLMRYVGGQHRPPDSAPWFADALRRYGLTAVVFVHSAPWRGEMQNVVERQGWRPLSSGAYDLWVKSGRGTATENHAAGAPSQVSSFTK